MHKYVIQRLLFTLLILFAVSYLVFTLLYLTPGDPASLILGPQALPVEIEYFNEVHNLNKPYLVRFADYVAGIVTQFDFGLSYRSNQPVVDELVHRFPITFNLAWLGIISSIILGVPLGIIAAVRHSTIVDHSVNIWAIFIGSVPAFWLALVLVILFSVQLGWFPVFGMGTWRHYVLPVVSMSVPGSAAFIRITRAVMLDTVHQEYVKTARAVGCSERVVIWKHAFRNAMLPVINSAGLAFAGLLGGAVLTETIFAMHGIGTYALTALRAKDIPCVMASVIFLSFIFCIVVLVIDLLYAFLDPRIKAKFAS